VAERRDTITEVTGSSPGSRSTCLRCECPIEKHCKGVVFHHSHKHNQVGHFCRGRHCLTPMCSCIELQLAPEPEPVPSEPSPEVTLARAISPFR
jgi:hypothetical protein